MRVIFLRALAAFLSFVILTSVVCILTGNMRRGYATLPHSDSVVVAGNTIALTQLVNHYQPHLFKNSGVFSPPALTMWWEAIDAGDSIALVYHPVWQDERHPVPIFHWIYYLYRAIVYGTPVRDIEYIQINVNRSDGSIQRIRYESSSSKSYDDWVGKHVSIIVDRAGTSQYIATVASHNNIPPRTLQIHGHELRFGILNWSHQFILLEDGSDKYTVPITMPLEYLTDELYSHYKLARRSQGDFATEDSAVGKAATSIMRGLILGVPYLVSHSIKGQMG